MIDPIDFSAVYAAQADINETVLRVLQSHQKTIELMQERINTLEGEQ